MVKRKRIYISPEKKKQIIKGLLENDSDIKLLATKYQVTAKTLGKWRRDYYKAEKGGELTKPEQHFVDIMVPKNWTIKIAK